MMLAAVSCLMLSLWRLTSDLGWTGEFVIETGFLSHWQVWLALTFATGTLAIRLMRLARDAEAARFTPAITTDIAPGIASETEPPLPREVVSR